MITTLLQIRLHDLVPSLNDIAEEVFEPYGFYYIGSAIDQALMNIHAPSYHLNFWKSRNCPLKKRNGCSPCTTHACEGKPVLPNWREKTCCGRYQMFSKVPWDKLGTKCIESTNNEANSGAKWAWCWAILLVFWCAFDVFIFRFLFSLIFMPCHHCWTCQWFYRTLQQLCTTSDSHEKKDMEEIS